MHAHTQYWYFKHGQLQVRQSVQRQVEYTDEDETNSTDNSSLDSDDVADYLANVQPRSADSNSAEEQVCYKTSAIFDLIPRSCGVGNAVGWPQLHV